LLQYGANVNAVDQYKATPLHRAAANRTNFSYKITKLLLDKLASVNAQDQEGISPLHIACQENNESVALELVQAGADVELENQAGRNSLDECSEELLEKVISLARKMHPQMD